jgi:hypothetical protein
MPVFIHSIFMYVKGSTKTNFTFAKSYNLYLGGISVKGGLKELHNEQLQIQEDEMGREYSTHAGHSGRAV